MLHAHDLLTLCLEELIIRASRRYAGCREKMVDASHTEQRALKRLSVRHLANIEKLVALRASVIRERGAGTAPPEIAAVTNPKRRIRLQDDQVHLEYRGARGRRRQDQGASVITR